MAEWRRAERAVVTGPERLPGVVPVTADDAASAAVTVEVDGETVALHPDEFDGTNYDWLSGPMPAMDSR